MRILICHGYLLRGTGSNQYVQSLSRSLCARGHQVLLMCQESDPSLDFVSSFVEETEGAPVFLWEKETDYPGNCMVYKPDIGGLLPVHVLDSYPGFEVKAFTELSDEELLRYVELNRQSLERLVRQFVPDLIHANHAVMLPYVVRSVAEERGVPYFVSVHGSDVEFAVRRDSRYLEYGIRGLEGAARLLVPSENTAKQVLKVFGPALTGTGARLELLAPGVDTALFRPVQAGFRESVERMLEAVAERTAGVTVGDFIGRRAGAELLPGEPGPLNIEYEIDRINGLHPGRLPDQGMGRRLLELADSGSPFVMYLGKLLETKGVQCVIPALPLLLGERPRARLVVVGFGELRGLLELMIAALDAGEIRAFKKLCEYGNEAYSSRLAEPFAPALEFLETLASEGNMDSYVRLCTGIDLAGAVIFTGYLSPEEHRHILPHARALLVPSLAEEAFGTAALEAMASGVLPLASCHSGPRCAAEPVREIWGREADKLVLGTSEKMVFRIAAAYRTVIDMSPGLLERKGAELRAVAERRFSWEAAGGRVLELYEEALGRGPRLSNPRDGSSGPSETADGSGR